MGNDTTKCRFPYLFTIGRTFADAPKDLMLNC